MGVRVKKFANNVPNGSTTVTDPVTRETTYDGQTYAWGPGETRNFLDDGVGLGHAAFDDGGEDLVKQDEVPFGSSRS